MTKKKPAPAQTPQHVATLGKSLYGTPQPQLHVILADSIGASHRRRRAALYGWAAKIELATPPSEGWAVVVDFDGPDGDCVHLELIEADKRECDAAMALLYALGQARGQIQDLPQRRHRGLGHDPEPRGRRRRRMSPLRRLSSRGRQLRLRETSIWLCLA